MKLEASAAEIAEFMSLGRFTGSLASDEIGKLTVMDLTVVKTIHEVDDDFKVKIHKAVIELYGEYYDLQKQKKPQPAATGNQGLKK